ncbi:MAG: hypothetical protein GHCLOJNM_03141 [bacterium]|nr:hypothetical protein [bacterium]
MKKWMIVTIATALAVCFAQPIFAEAKVAASEASEQSRALAGYVDLDLKTLLGPTKPNVAVLLEGPMIQIAASAAAAAGSPISGLLDQLKLVRVQVYESLPESATKQDVTEKVAPMVEGLKGQGWTPAVSVPEEDESVEILVKISEDKILGVVVLVVSSDEVVFVNIAGELDPKALGGTLGKLKDAIKTGNVDIEDLLFSGEADKDESDADSDPAASTESASAGSSAEGSAKN